MPLALLVEITGWIPGLVGILGTGSLADRLWCINSVESDYMRTLEP